MTLITTNAVAGLVLGCCLLGSAGCGPKLAMPSVGHDRHREAIQASVASETIVTQAMDAATQALMQDATTAWTRRMGHPELAGAAAASASRTDLQVAFSSLADPDGKPRFAHTSGEFTLHAEGRSVPSWPLGATVMSSHHVTVVFDRGPVAFTDPVSKVTATITGGSYAYEVDTTCTFRADGGWSLALDSQVTVPVTAPLQARIDRPRRASRSVSISGGRAAHLRMDRQHGGDADTLAAEITYDGTAIDGATVIGAVGVDPRQPGLSFTNWDLTLDGSEHLVWNRRLHGKAHWDYGVTPTKRTVDDFTQTIFLTRDGVVTGPYGAMDLALVFRSSAN
jgi:hypothetical protein